MQHDCRRTAARRIASQRRAPRRIAPQRNVPFPLTQEHSMNDFPIAKNGADVQALATVLDKLAVGSVATYAELTEAIGRDILNHRYLLDQTLNRLMRGRKIFGCVKGVGYQRLSDSEIVESSFGAMRRIRRMARKQATRLASVEWNRMSDADRLAHNIHVSVLGAIAHAATPSNLAKLNHACVNSSGQVGLPTAKTLALLAS
jgi:hypothetical protein